jgi:hypothetical protein
MSLQISHVLINIDDLSTLHVYLSEEFFDNLGEFGELIFDYAMILFILVPYVSEKLLEMLRIIQDKLVDNGFVQIDAGELVGVTFNDDRRHGREMLRDYHSAGLHDE